MKGLTPATLSIFKALSVLPCITPYTLIGGTALSLQIEKRLSEDIDFCIWSKNLRDRNQQAVDWPQINSELERIGTIERMDVLGFDQVNFLVNGVRITFFIKSQNRSPVKNEIAILNNIRIADIESIGVMKIELLLRRSDWKDYYDIYSILKEGVSLKKMVEGAKAYSNNLLKSRDVLSFLANSSNYHKHKDFALLNPAYPVTGKEIEDFISARILSEYPLKIRKRT